MRWNYEESSTLVMMAFYKALVVLFCFFELGDFNSDDTLDFHKNLPAQVVWAVLGDDVDLPCDVTPPMPSDNVSMVLWFKGSTGIPLYSCNEASSVTEFGSTTVTLPNQAQPSGIRSQYGGAEGSTTVDRVGRSTTSLDSRGGPLENATHWAISTGLGGRSFFVPGRDPSKAHLHISRVDIADEGIFRCRVDFFNSPTRNFRVNLTLVVQPSIPKIFNAQGREVLTTAGPFLEGYDLFLSCQVTGGRPHPTVSWWKDGAILDGVVDTTVDSSTTVNQLFISRVTRQLYNTRLQCRAQSSHLSRPVIKEIQIIVYLKPLKVKILGENELLSVQKTHQVRCEASGSYPPAEIIWLLDGEHIRNSNVSKSPFGNRTLSTLSFNVNIADDGKELVCRAINQRFPGGFMEDRRTLHVAYPPAVYVVAGPDMDLSNLNEGDNIRLTCEAHASPAPRAYSWYHGEQLIAYNESAGTLPDDRSLMLRNISRDSAGEYRCAAINSEGETRSIPFRIKIQYAPRCRAGAEVNTVPAVHHDTVSVECEVDARPSTNVRFSWTYNNSRGDVLPVQGARVTSTGLVSRIQFSAARTTADEYGTLACWASNEIGNQRVPCYFHIVPASAPNPPQDCELRRMLDGGLEVVCLPGSDGGVQQHFSLEVTSAVVPSLLHGTHDRTMNDQATDPTTKPPPIYKILEHQPMFRLHSLEPGRTYTVYIHAINAKGRSEPPIVLNNIYVPEPIQRFQTEDVFTFESEEPTPSTERRQEDDHKVIVWLAITCTVILIVALVVLAVVVVVCSCRSAKRRQQNRQVVNKRESANLSIQMQAIGPPHILEEDGGFGENFQRRSAEWASRIASIDQNVPISRRISQQFVIDHPDLILH